MSDYDITNDIVGMVALNMLDNDVTLTLAIENFYPGSCRAVRTRATIQVPPPPTDTETDWYDEWAYEHIYPATGTGRTEGDSAYFVEVIASSRPELIPVGTKFEFGL